MTLFLFWREGRVSPRLHDAVQAALHFLYLQQTHRNKHRGGRITIPFHGPSMIALGRARLRALVCRRGSIVCHLLSHDLHLVYLSMSAHIREECFRHTANARDRRVALLLEVLRVDLNGTFYFRKRGVIRVSLGDGSKVRPLTLIELNQSHAHSHSRSPNSITCRILEPEGAVA